MKYRYILLGTICVAALVQGSQTVRAETMDYGALQAVFGEPVTTAATGTPQRERDVPSNMTIITADEIRRLGSRNIPEILSRVPGLDILQTGETGFDVGVRGFQQAFQPRLLVLVDGRQVFVDDYSRTLWDNIPVNIDDIRQIEVVKGAASALYGSNAAGGVINIITYSPLYDNNNVASLTVGTQNTVEGDGTATIKGDWGGSKFSVGGMNADEFGTARNPSGDQTPPINPRKRYLVNSSVFKLSPDVQADTEFTYSQSYANTGDPVDLFVVGSQKTTTYSARAGFSWQTPYGMITNNNYFNHSFVDLYEPTDGGAPYGFTTNLVVSQLDDQFKLGNDHTLRVGLEYRYKNFKDDGAFLAPIVPALDEHNYAANAMWLWQVNDRLSWTNAARIDVQQMAETGMLWQDAIIKQDAYGHTNTVWSGNSDIVYKATDFDSFRLGYGRGVQLPSLIQSGNIIVQDFGSVTGDYEGNPDLKPTIVQDYSLDYTRKIPDVFSDLKFSTYYELNQDIASPYVTLSYPVINGVTYQYGQTINVGNSSGYGGEVQFKGKNPSGYRWDASYSFTRVTDSGQSVIDNVNYQGSAPQHHLRLLLGYTTGPWELDGKGQYLSSSNMLRTSDGGVTFPPVRTDGYLTFSGRVGYKINDNFTAAVSGTNLNRHELGASPYPAIERQLFLTLTGKL